MESEQVDRCITSDIQLYTAEAKSCEMEFVPDKTLPDTCNTIQSYMQKFLACLEQIALCGMSNEITNGVCRQTVKFGTIIFSDKKSE